MTSLSPANIATIDGVECVNRAGLCELTGLSLESINHLAAPARREKSGCPAPLPGTGRTRWYPLDQAREWADQLRRPAAPAPPQTAGPDDLITITQFRTEVMRPSVTDNTMRGYIRMSRAAWEQGQDGYLPKPDSWEPARRGQSPRWYRSRAIEWQAGRPGQPTTGRPPESQRAPRPAPPIDDPDELIGETRFRTQIMQPPMSRTAFKRHLADSEAAWKQEREGFLPRPASQEPRAEGIAYRWRAGIAAAWQNARASGANGNAS